MVERHQRIRRVLAAPSEFLALNHHRSALVPAMYRCCNSCAQKQTLCSSLAPNEKPSPHVSTICVDINQWHVSSTASRYYQRHCFTPSPLRPRRPVKRTAFYRHGSTGSPGQARLVPRLSIPMITYSAGIFAHRFGASIQRTPDITSSLTPCCDPMSSNKGSYIGPVSQLAADAV